VRGRDPQLKLKRGGGEILLRDWANEIFEQMSAGCELLDKDAEEHAYCSTLQHQRAKIKDPDLTPSARMLAEMADNREEFYHFAMRMSQQHQQQFAERPLDVDKQASFETAARESIEKQHAIEDADEIPFATFLQNYFNQV